MAVIDDIYSAVLAWLKVAAVAPAVDDLTNQQVIRARQPGPRPAKPYLTVQVTAPGAQNGELDDYHEIDSGTDVGTVWARGEYRGTVTITGFGSASYEWIVTAIQRLRHETILRQLTAAGITIDPSGPPLDVGQLLGSAFEDRWSQDVSIVYSLDGPAETVIEATKTKTEYTGQGSKAGASSDLTVTITTP